MLISKIWGNYTVHPLKLAVENRVAVKPHQKIMSQEVCTLRKNKIQIH
jgi:hypothetical protein